MAIKIRKCQNCGKLITVNSRDVAARVTSKSDEGTTYELRCPHCEFPVQAFFKTEQVATD